MALDRDELNRRRQAREERRKKREAERRRMYFGLAAAALVLIICGAVIFFMSRDNNTAEKPTEPSSVKSTSAPTEAPTEAPTTARQANATTVIHVVAGGDLNVTDKSVWAGQTTGNFDYTEAFLDVASIFTGADLAMLNFEGNFCGSPYGTQTQSAPIEMAQALDAAGVDLLQMANSCAVSNGMNGLITTLNNIRANGMEPVGAYTSVEEFQKAKGYTICEVQGIKIAVVAFTKGVGGLSLPTGSEDCVNLLYSDYSTTYQELDTEGIYSILKAVESEKPDLTIALLHWGSEYNDKHTEAQEELAEMMMNRGVDVIIGSHPHLVHKISYDDTTGELVAYSLGDFFGDATRAGTNYAILLDLEITRNNDTGATRVTGYDYIPIYTLSETEGYGQRRVVRLEDAVVAYQANYIDKVTADAYASMTYALQRIEARVKGE